MKLSRLALAACAVFAIASTAPVLTGCATGPVTISDADLTKGAVNTELAFTPLVAIFGADSLRVREGYGGLLALRRVYDIKMLGKPLDPALAAARAANDALMGAPL